VAVGDYRSEADEDEAAREREETKRLLYVALTRARDRLYLSTPLKDGRVQPGRGSLADVLPASLLETLAQAHLAGGHAEWAVAGATAHRFHVVTVAAQIQATAAGAHTPGGSIGSAAADFDRIADVASIRTTVATLASADASPAVESKDASTRVVGRLVHRLLQRYGLTDPIDDTQLVGAVADLLRREERAELASDPDAEDVMARFQALRASARFRTASAQGEVFYEVPFTFQDGGQIVRGAIDCLIRHADGTIQVLEFKTGHPREEHASQAEVYRRAAAAVFPGAQVSVDILYSSEEIARLGIPGGSQ
jgi:ATP-dependent helicase/nuclease subunit A